MDRKKVDVGKLVQVGGRLKCNQTSLLSLRADDLGEAPPGFHEAPLAQSCMFTRLLIQTERGDWSVRDMHETSF
jgi:hypothetical protein